MLRTAWQHFSSVEPLRGVDAAKFWSVVDASWPMHRAVQDVIAMRRAEQRGRAVSTLAPQWRAYAGTPSSTFQLLSRYRYVVSEAVFVQREALISQTLVDLGASDNATKEVATRFLWRFAGIECLQAGRVSAFAEAMCLEEGVVVHTPSHLGPGTFQVVVRARSSSVTLDFDDGYRAGFALASLHCVGDIVVR